MKIRLHHLLKICFMLVFSALSVSSFAQSKVSGTVTDSKSGSPISGVTVSLKGTTTATKTNAAGVYEITAPANGTLVFTSVNYGSEQVAIGGKTSVNVGLTQSVNVNEAVVVVGYGTARKKDLTGSINVVTAKDFQKGAISTPEQMLAGKVAGVSIVSNGGQPGAGSTIRIRGGSSLNASNDPLIVIDGVPLDQNGINGASSALSFINSNDIETFTVLKDASAAAIYGTRGSNGVIIITTKKGKAGALKFNFSTNISVANKTGIVDVLSGDEVRTIVNQLGNAKQKSQVGTANTNWQDAIYQTAISTDNNLSFSGGIKKLPYRVSLGYSYLNGILRTDHLQKTSAALAVNPTFLNNTLKVDVNLKVSKQNTRFGNQGAIGGAVSFDPTQNVKSNSPRYNGYYEWLESNGDLILNRPNNPVAVLEQTFDKQSPIRSIGNIQFDYMIPHVKGLKANLNLAYDVSKSTGTYFVNDSAAQAYVTGQPTKSGSSSSNKSTKQNSVLDFYLNYIKEISSIKSRIDFTAGYTYNNYFATYYNYRGYTAKGDTIAGTKAPQFAFNKPENTLIGLFGRLNYALDDKYFLTATLRRDGSSRFSKENRWGTFPSLGLSWRVAKEKFLQDNKIISDLKLRAGYGEVGQQDGIGNYSYLSTYSLSGPNSLTQFGANNYNTYAPSGFYADLKWERTAGYNVGLDLGLLKNKITASVDFYLKKTKDLLNEIPQPAGTNFSAYVLANIGEMENKGFEANLNYTPIKNNKFTWDLNFNATYNKNTITNLTVVPQDLNYKGAPAGGAAGVNGPIKLHQIGYPKGTFNLLHQYTDPSGKPLENLFVDANRDGLINEDDRFLTKAPDANLFFGFSTNVTYKKWNAGIVLRSSFNNYIYNNVFSNLGKQTQILNAYTISNGSTNYLDTRFEGKTDIQGFSDYYLENASFLRMDNLSLGYNYGQIAKTKSTLRFGLNAQNVFVITKYKGLDPEVNGGVDNNLYPRPRIISLSASIDF